MSIATEINRIQTDRNTIRTKLVELGLSTTTANLTALATAIEDIINRGAVSVTVQEGDTYTIPAGYHNGSGTVSGVAGGGNYSLQSKTATPTKKQQNITPDSGYYGLSDVTISAIPEAYQDVTSVTAEAGNVLTGKVFVASDGTLITGTMANNGTVSKTLDGTTISYTIPAGYHSGSGKVTITLEEKSVTPTKSTQTVTPTSGKVLSKVTVNPIPSNYITTTDATAGADEILLGETAYVNGSKVTGTMPNNGAFSSILEPGSTSVKIPKGYHNGTGEVNVSVSATPLVVTPTEETQSIASSGEFIDNVTVNPIPGNYIDTLDATAIAGNILAGKTAYGYKETDGVKTPVKLTGTMTNNGTKSKVLDMTTPSYTIPKGYHSGSGKVSIDKQPKTATPTKSVQNITADTGYVLSQVTVSAIPDEYITTTDADAVAADILSGKTAYVGGSKVTGSMPKNSNSKINFNALTTTGVTIPKGYHDGTGGIQLTSSVEDALKAI